MASPAPHQRRFCFALDLKNDQALIAAYKAFHKPGAVPVAVVGAMRNQGIRALEIYNCGDRLFMIMEVNQDYDSEIAEAQDAINPDVVAWQDLMWEFQKRLPFAKPGQKWVPMTQIFGLGG